MKPMLLMFVAAVTGALCGHLAFLLVADSTDNLGGPIMGITGAFGLVLAVGLVETLERKRGERQ